MDVTTLPKGQSKERTDGRPINEPGTYKHKDTGRIYITPEGEEGIIHADALNSPIWKDSWERVGGVPSRTELLKQQKEAVSKIEAQEKAKKLEKAKKEVAELQPAPGTGETF
jgi:hypothetical protein